MRTLLPLSIILIAIQFVFSEDFKTTNGREYKNATVTRVEPDGILIKFKGGIVKLPFTELPNDIQARFHYDASAASAYRAGEAASVDETNQRANLLDRLKRESSEERQKRSAEQQTRQNNVQALVDQLAALEQEEQHLLVQIGRAEADQTTASRKWIDNRNQSYTYDSAEAKLPLLRGQLSNVRDKKERVARQLEQAQK